MINSSNNIIKTNTHLKILNIYSYDAWLCKYMCLGEAQKCIGVNETPPRLIIGQKHRHRYRNYHLCSTKLWKMDWLDILYRRAVYNSQNYCKHSMIQSGQSLPRWNGIDTVSIVCVTLKSNYCMYQNTPSQDEICTEFNLKRVDICLYRMFNIGNIPIRKHLIQITSGITYHLLRVISLEQSVGIRFKVLNYALD